MAENSDSRPCQPEGRPDRRGILAGIFLKNFALNLPICQQFQDELYGQTGHSDHRLPTLGIRIGGDALAAMPLY